MSLITSEGVFLFNLSKDSITKSWTVDLSSEPRRVKQEKCEKADVTITVSDEDFFSLAIGFPEVRI